mmetsp:Transcript_12769/g.46711  ORF Transcript_12769/g.46711 Transcript_12769/m.46711 type:complete len:257 (+) Transcript_12769:2907-3677(+)
MFLAILAQSPGGEDLSYEVDFPARLIHPRVVQFDDVLVLEVPQQVDLLLQALTLLLGAEQALRVQLVPRHLHALLLVECAIYRLGGSHAQHFARPSIAASRVHFLKVAGVRLLTHIAQAALALPLDLLRRLLDVSAGIRRRLLLLRQRVEAPVAVPVVMVAMELLVSHRVVAAQIRQRHGRRHVRLGHRASARLVGHDDDDAADALNGASVKLNEPRALATLKVPPNLHRAGMGAATATSCFLVYSWHLLAPATDL